MRSRDDPPGDPVRDALALLPSQQVQAGVDPGRGPGAGDDPPLVDVQLIRFQRHQREACPEDIRPLPVRRGCVPVQHAAVVEGEGAEAEAEQFGAVVPRIAQRGRQLIDVGDT